MGFAQWRISIIFPNEMKRLLRLRMIAMAFCLAWEASGAEESKPTLRPVHRIQVNGEERLDVLTGKTNGAPAFYAIVTNRWPSGLAPIFSVELNGKWELRRRPARGQENFTEPLFFGFAPVDEPNAAKLNGYWTCHAASEEGSKNYPGMELMLDGERVAGRFDPNTDYRFAFITSGRFHADELELRVEYIKDSYVLNGKWSNGRIKGTWVKSDESDKGTWEGERAPASAATQLEQEKIKGLVALYEWRRPADDFKRYELEGKYPGKDWIRSERPLCRIWKRP